VSDILPLSLTTLVVRNPGLVEAEIDQEVVTLNIDTGNCYGLNSVGSRIWSLLASPIRGADVCAHLVQEFQVQQNTCESQVLELLEELRAEGLISALADT
jgi:coenzyme PQQ synthesis protein D (PqqD)